MIRKTDTTASAKPITRRISSAIYRLAALCFFAMGALYWARLAGLYDATLWRFDLMPLSLRAAACTFAVLYPVAGLGLWLAGSWGAVLWAMVALIEAGLLAFSQLSFPGADWIVLGHGVGLGLVLLLRIADILSRWRGATLARRQAVARS